MLSNLKLVYFQQKDFERAVRVIERARQLNPGETLLRRDLGIALLQAGQAGRAIDHLAAYVAAAPEHEDVDGVRLLLRQAEGAVARWN
jgi:regulator of sirC expression with transglutaminase-like and TPR domain